MNSHRTSLAVFCGGLALWTAGCVRGGPDRLPLHGTVKTVAGEQLNASITFLPNGGTKRPVANGSVINGEYRFDRTTGPTAGPTEIIVRRTTARRDSISRSVAKRKPAVLEKSEWKQMRIIADDGRYLQDFTLEN